MYLGSWKIDDNLTFPANTHNAVTGAATDADSVPSYRVYEDETATPILTGSMAKLDDANTTGFYSEQIALSAANGFEKGKSYTIYISAAVNSVTGTMAHCLQIEAEVDANTVSGGVNVTQISGDSTAADNAELAFDGTGYGFTGCTVPTVTSVTNGVSLADGAITAAKIASDAIAAAKIADGAITADKIASSAVTAAKIASDAITAAKIADGAITAAKIADDAIDNATFADDVGTTAYASNHIALACDKALVQQNLDHLLKVAVADTGTLAEVVDDTVMACVMTSDGDSSGYNLATDSLEAIRDALSTSTVTTVAAVSGSDVTVVPYTTWEFTIDGLADLSGAAANGVFFTVKEKHTDPDSSAILQVQEGVGLTVLNGSDSVTAAKATLTVAGTEDEITVHVNASQTGMTEKRELVYDVKMVITASEDADQMATGSFHIADEAVTRALTTS